MKTVKCSKRSAADDPDDLESAASARMFHTRTVIGFFCNSTVLAERQVHIGDYAYRKIRQQGGLHFSPLHDHLRNGL